MNKLEVNNYELHKKKIARNFAIQDSLRGNVSVEELFSYGKEKNYRLLLEVFTYEASIDRYVSDLVSWPATWWEALKERFAPRWFLRRWPVEYEVRNFEHTLKANIVVPDILSDREVIYLYELDGQPLNPERPDR